VRSADDKASLRGFTLLEILIVIAIVGILVAIAVRNFGGLNEKYKVEAETKQLFSDLMDARGRAMQRNRASFVQVNVTITRRTRIHPCARRGRGAAETRTRLSYDAKVSHAIATGNIAVPLIFNFNRNGSPRLRDSSGFPRRDSRTTIAFG